MGLLAVMIVFNCKLEETKTLVSLLKNFENNQNIFERFKLIIYDNSKIIQDIDFVIPFNYEYIHNPKNIGLAGAYNHALAEGSKYFSKWLLLLDQDSSLPADFISCLSDTTLEFENDKTVFSIAPKMFYNDALFSPSKVIYGGIHRPIDKNCTGFCDFEVFAIGSCSCVRISFLNEIGGFNGVFWLDCLDRWLYLKIKEKGGAVYITDSHIKHELSVLDYDKFINKERYVNIINYESLFMKLYKSKPENIIYYVRLLKRIFSFGFGPNKRIYSNITLRHLFSLIFQTNSRFKFDFLKKQILYDR
jgi:GT2 family glycosyltransferase